MYRISVRAKQKNKDYSFIDSPGAWSAGYFGPCSKSDLNVFPSNVLEKFKNSDNYIDFSVLALDESRRITKRIDLARVLFYFHILEIMKKY